MYQTDSSDWLYSITGLKSIRREGKELIIVTANEISDDIAKFLATQYSYRPLCINETLFS